MATDMISVAGGNYKPILGKKKDVAVHGFFIDETAVTNREFQLFIKEIPSWQKTKTPLIFADSNYLKSWKLPINTNDPSLDSSPVVNVSWFAAKAYCEWLKKRLPTVDEWEYLAQFGPADKKDDPKDIILEWYSRPTPAKLPPVKSTFKNKFSVWDFHGLIWEWTYDFNTAFVTGESRGDSAIERSMFCGGAAAGSPNPSDYAAFMRFGFRSSLKANYTVENLGFRCARDIKP